MQRTKQLVYIAALTLAFLSIGLHFFGVDFAFCLTMVATGQGTALVAALLPKQQYIVAAWFTTLLMLAIYYRLFRRLQVTVQKPEVKRRSFPASIYLGSGSKIKVDALQNAINKSEMNAAVYPIKNATSGIREQPLGFHEILRGAFNRVMSAQENDPRGDVYIAIENGIEYVREDKDDIDSPGVWVDYAVVLAYVPLYGQMIWVRSNGVDFPEEAVVATNTKPGGFDVNTVGKTLQEMGLVKRHDDPHLDLVGVSRREILENALRELFKYLPVGLDLFHKPETNYGGV